MPVVCSSYRTQEYQEGLFQNRIDRYVKEGYSVEEATGLAGQSVAVPGTSEHQLGLALDIVDNRNWELDESQADMPTQQWLMENSWRYGWILRYPNEKSAITGIIYEPWHYRYVGKTIAKEIYDLGICLEEYLQMLTNSVG
jgi:D-alanyl-D-alanine carboxypeptidase